MTRILDLRKFFAGDPFCLLQETRPEAPVLGLGRIVRVLSYGNYLPVHVEFADKRGPSHP